MNWVCVYTNKMSKRDKIVTKGTVLDLNHDYALATSKVKKFHKKKIQE